MIDDTKRPTGRDFPSVINDIGSEGTPGWHNSQVQYLVLAVFVTSAEDVEQRPSQLVPMCTQEVKYEMSSNFVH